VISLPLSSKICISPLYGFELLYDIVSSAANTTRSLKFRIFGNQLYIAVLVVSFQADPSHESGDGKKSRVSRKHVIIGVTCAVVTAMVIAGVIVGVKFFLDSTNEIVKVSNRLLQQYMSSVVGLLSVMMRSFTVLRVKYNQADLQSVS